MIHRFYSTCDACEKASADYECFPHCRDCMRNICPACVVAGETWEEQNTTLCESCRVARSLEPLEPGSEILP